MIRIARAALAAAALGGCGYGFAVGGPGLPAGVERVYVPVFENRSTEAEAGALFAEALAHALASAGHIGGAEAPARVEGTVLSVDAAPAATGPDGRGVGIYRIAATVRLSLVDQGQVRCVREIEGAEDFLPTADLLGIEASRRQALRRLAERLMHGASASLCPVVGDAG